MLRKQRILFWYLLTQCVIQWRCNREGRRTTDVASSYFSKLISPYTYLPVLHISLSSNQLRKLWRPNEQSIQMTLARWGILVFNYVGFTWLACEKAYISGLHYSPKYRRDFSWTIWTVESVCTKGRRLKVRLTICRCPFSITFQQSVLHRFMFRFVFQHYVFLSMVEEYCTNTISLLSEGR